MDATTHGERLISKLAELQAMFAHLRSYEGPFDPQFPRTVFHLLFCPPLHCSIDPFETLGILQRIFHSKDGKYLVVSFGASFGRQARFWRERATAEDRRAIMVLREIRSIAQEHRIWATYVGPNDSWFLPYSSTPGVLQPTPGEPKVVSFDEYLVRLSEFDRTDPPTPGELLSFSIDMHDISKTIPNSEVVTTMPDECRVCAVHLADWGADSAPPAAGYMRDARQCPSCRIIYIREPQDSELTADEAEMRDVRREVVREFLRRIQEEFPVSSGTVTADDIAEASGLGRDDPFNLFGGQTFGASDEAWRGE